MLDKHTKMVSQFIMILGGNMTIREKQPVSEIVIDLTGPDGNAFALMGYARRFAGQLNMNSKDIINEMMSGDYENLVQVFDKYFGDFVVLER
jgi:hypothetical protein